MINRESIVFARAPENKQQQSEARDDVAAEAKKGVVQQMTESHDGENATKRDKRVARTQSKNKKRAADQFDKRNGGTNRPERPSRKKSVGERQKIFPCMLERTELKNFHHAGHEEDETENKSGEEQSPGAVH